MENPPPVAPENSSNPPPPAGPKRNWAARIGLGVYILSAGVYSFVAMFLYLPPFSWLVRFQLDHFGSYYEEIALLGAFILALVPAVLILLILDLTERISLSNRRASPRASEATQPADGPSPPAALATSQSAGSPDRFSRNLKVVCGLVAGLGFFVCGLYFHLHARGIGARQDLDVSEYYGPNKPTAEYVSLAGEPLWDQARGWSGDSVGSGTWYVPLVPRSGSQPTKIALFVKVAQREVERAQAASRFEGLIKLHGLPGALVENMEKDGTGPAADYRVLAWNETPDSTSQFGRFFMALGGGTIVVAGGMAGISSAWRRRRRPVQVGADRSAR